MTKNGFDVVTSVVRDGLCTGCGLCEAIAPTGVIRVDECADGYFRPVVSEENLPDDWATMFKSTCPGIAVEHTRIPKNYHHLWGPLVGTRTGYARNEELRRLGSSGGAISAIAAYLLEKGMIRYVAQIAVNRSDPFRNELQLSENFADVLNACGSRYSPSAPLRTLRTLLDRGEPFAFVGKPCDIAALERYGAYDPRVAALVRYKLSFMCAGIPSTLATDRLLEKMGTRRSEVTSFRYRGDGWPGMARAVTHEGRILEMDYATSWGTILNRHLQFRCKVCPDGTGEFADIVGADAWYGKDGYPDFSEKDGRSLILTRSSRGEALIVNMIQDGHLQAEFEPIENLALIQPYQASRKAAVVSRLAAMAVCGRRIPRFRGLMLFAAARTTTLGRHFREFAGMLRRSLLRRHLHIPGGNR